MKYLLLLVSVILVGCQSSDFSLHYDKRHLTVSGELIPGKKLNILYIEAYCRANSTDADWVKYTVIKHKTKVVKNTPEEVIIIDEVSDGVVVEHIISVDSNGVNFEITAKNTSDKASEIHWAQPCVQVGEFTGKGKSQTDDKYAYMAYSFIFLNGKAKFMPTKNWAMKARYIPGQVWCPKHVPRTDVNPRPLSDFVPSNGLIGCLNREKGVVLGIAFEPYQELFQGVIRCLHSDFRFGGLKPGETKKVRGKLYLIKGSIEDLVEEYE
ncbi:MAG: hypothetical protein NE328_17180, partial [Lentisphaeraceae bacterium]|nr:hypothetical protein [Lentisphaeraceae bacterium]